MYPKADWWIERSGDTEHQEAYDLVASSIPLDESQVFLEACCGNGEFLKRVAGRVKKVVGSDITDKMLEEAHRNLSAYGLDVKVFDGSVSSGVWADELKRDRIVLVKDDIAHTALPPSYFDHVAMIFPDLVTVELLEVDARRVAAYHSGDFNDYVLKTRETEACYNRVVGQANENCLKVLKKGGLFTYVCYDSEHMDQLTRVVRSYPRVVFGHVGQCKFFKNSEVFKDAEHPMEPGTDYGFTIATIRDAAYRQ